MATVHSTLLTRPARQTRSLRVLVLDYTYIVSAVILVGLAAAALMSRDDGLGHGLIPERVLRNF
jgi:hypothetical protein